jgi:hypothetical protein
MNAMTARKDTRNRLMIHLPTESLTHNPSLRAAKVLDYLYAPDF